jgi:hypothetical protein
MNVRVVLHSYLREKLPPEAKGRTLIELTEGATAGILFERLGLPEHVAWSVNGVIQRERGLVLRDGDEVRVFRQGAGG